MDREELLRSARNLYENPGTNEALKVVLEETYPELKESEDERIRTRLIALVEAFGQGAYKTEMLSYLERQKEQKPVVIQVENPNIEKFNPDVKVTTSDSSAGGKELLYVSNKSYDIGFRDGVNSVNPAEWSEEDEKHLNWVIENFSQAGGLYDDLIYWLTQLPKRFNLQSNQEWGEEDWKLLDEMREHLIHVMGNRPDITKNKIYEGFINLVDKLKSLRPQSHWKPSEEQMDWFGQAILNSSNATMKKALRSLYEDLKKL